MNFILLGILNKTRKINLDDWSSQTDSSSSKDIWFSLLVSENFAEEKIFLLKDIRDPNFSVLL